MVVDLNESRAGQAERFMRDSVNMAAAQYLLTKSIAGSWHQLVISCPLAGGDTAGAGEQAAQPLNGSIAIHMSESSLADLLQKSGGEPVPYRAAYKFIDYDTDRLASPETADVVAESTGER